MVLTENCVVEYKGDWSVKCLGSIEIYSQIYYKVIEQVFTLFVTT
jgi:hypothetical protein